MERQLRTQRNFITWFGLTVMLLLATAVFGHAQIKVVQSVHVQSPVTNLSCTFGADSSGYTYSCDPAAIPAVTVNVAPTISGNALAIVGGVSCIDNLGYLWGGGPWFFGLPPSGENTGGISSITCTPYDASVDFYEISGVKPAPISLEAVLSASCPPSLGNNSINIFAFNAQAVSGAVNCLPIPATWTGALFAGCEGGVTGWNPPNVAVSISESPGPGYSGPVSTGFTEVDWWTVGFLGYSGLWPSSDLLEQNITAGLTASEYQVNGPSDAGGVPATFSYTFTGPYGPTSSTACSGIAFQGLPPLSGETDLGCVPGAGCPISLASGNTYIQQTDIKLPGLGGGLTLERTWNSAWPATQSTSQVGMFGPNWRSSYEERVFENESQTDTYLKYARADGSFWSFPTVGGAIIAPANAGVTIASGPSYWTITFKNGETRLFSNTSGSLAAIIDRNGNATRMGYDMLGRLITVTDAAGRSLQFNYGNGNYDLVTSVTSSVGVITGYNYDKQYRLIQATKPDQSYVTFQYNAQSLITAVLDSTGKVLESHTYDSSARGLTSSRANGVEAITMTYPTTQ